MTPFSVTRNRLQSWAVSSQQQARRNAMIASTRLAQRRAERLEVEHYLELVAQRRDAAADTSVEPAAPAAHA